MTQKSERNATVATSAGDVAGRPEAYAHGYDSALTLKMHASRTADRQAAWFLPHLHPGLSLLDCGCGSGSITVGLAGAASPGRVVGVDVSEAEIERARARAAEAGVANAEFAVGDIYRLDFADEAFDAVFSHNVLEHLQDPAAALREMYRVLKPGGVIGIRDADFGGLLLWPPDPGVLMWVAAYEADWAGDGGDPRVGRRLRGLLDAAGFVAVETTASYEEYANRERLVFLSGIAMSRISEPDWAARVTARGLATQVQLQAMHAAFSAWPDTPGAFAALAHVEVIGRKPQEQPMPSAEWNETSRGGRRWDNLDWLGRYQQPGCTPAN